MPGIIVFGAGMAGLAPALALQDRGADVLLISKGEPQDAASFGNAGIIQAEAVEPYAFPRDPGTLWRMATGRDNGLHYTLRGTLPHSSALYQYWRNSAPARHAAISETYARLIRSALDDHAALIAATGTDQLVRKTGFLELHRDPRTFDAARVFAERQQAAHGVEHRALTPDMIRQTEPGLAPVAGGAIHWTEPWSLFDPGALLAACHETFVANGGTLATGDATDLASSGKGWTARHTGGTDSAAHVVLATGAATAEIARRFGHRFLLVPKRGYHLHLPDPGTLSRPIYDTANAIVLSPMRAGLRVLTGAAFTHRPDAASPQLARGLQVARDLLGVEPAGASPPWTGTRPCMADMLPVVGQSARHPGLWFHFGHGHQGLTLAPTTARLLAGQMLGADTAPQLTRALAPGRFGG